jgi:pimeloyl-ACP methyl ester carboxylesterase
MVYGAEGCSREADGWIDDDLAFVHPWGLQLAEISIPLQLWLGQHDRMVPPGQGHWLAEQLPAADRHFCPDDRHLSLLVSRISEIQGCLLEHF